LVTPKGYALGTLCVIDNVPRKLDESQILSLKALANQLVKLLELRISVIELNKSVEELKELNAVKDKLFSIIGHDLRGPIGGFKSLIELLISDYDLSDTKSLIEILQMIQKTANSTYDLLENLTKWLMSQNKNIPIKISKFDISIAIQTILTFYKIETEKKKISIVFDNTEKSYVLADEQMIKTIIRNLLSNAIKFTPENGEITIKIKKLKNEIHVAIKDTGIGIKEEDKEKIFRIDSNFTTSGTSKEKGSGLGLILSKEFAERNNSRIWFESEEGKGSTFYFSIMKKNNMDE
jgi:signal transduction histidine kinase